MIKALLDFVLLTADEYKMSPWSSELAPSSGIQLSSAHELVRALQSLYLQVNQQNALTLPVDVLP